ncbi:hypothetical protein [Algicella marina]|uniref:Sulfotransferase domain-containing protein n=1 Tax=Algicella marina TaxID=2683284 RepID=A0A6P1T628_9RHOB|nr:hypothetical protein [Algicella marina]QHQ36926.1 hypothetical protein GO499_17930 [Algicella marina]
MEWRSPRIFIGGSPGISHYQVLGERNSGTNFVSTLLRRNLGHGIVEERPYGWKHGFIDRRVVATPQLLTLVVYRHPVRWLQSVHSKPLELTDNFDNLTFDEFLRTPWTGGFVREGGPKEPSTADLEPKTARVFTSPMAVRTAKISYLEEMADMGGNIAYLRFEDVNRDPVRTLQALSDAFALALNAYQSIDGFKGDGGKYLPKHVPLPSAQQLTKIFDGLDWAVERSIGYDFDDVPTFDGLSPWDRRSLKSRWRELWRSGSKA